MSEATPGGVEAALRALLARRAPSPHGDFDVRDVRSDELRPAAVLVLLERGAAWRVVLTKRTMQVDHHKGEVSFAGGMRDAGDADAEATALREAHEELGLDPARVDIVGRLDSYFTVSKFLVTPVVGVVDPDLPLAPSPIEVERILRVPIAYLREPRHWFDDVREWRGERRVLRSCRFGEDLIWGATSRMLQRFLEIVPADLLP